MEIHAFRLHPGQDLKKEIQAYILRNRIEAGWIMTCVGSLSGAHIRFANRGEGTLHEGPFEIVSLVGTVSVNGSHLHIAISDGDGHTIGGHLLEGNLIYTTAEIVLGQSRAMAFHRAEDKDTGWRELNIVLRP